MLLRLCWGNTASTNGPKLFVSIAGVLAFVVPASAQDVTTELPPIVVEGATLEAPPVKPKRKPAASTTQPDTSAAAVESAISPGGNADAASSVQGVPIDEIGTAVTVITAAQLQAQQTRMAADALRSLPGVVVSQTGSPGGKTQVRIRGAEANHTLVYIDGIEANDVSDADFDWSNVTTDNIQQIEVIRGAQSGLYGAKAIGGVINIVTKGGRGPATVTGRIEAGSFGTKDVTARVSGGTDRLWLSFGGEYRESDGFNPALIGDEDDLWHNSTFTLKGGVGIMDGMTLDFVVRDTKKLVNFDEAPTTFPIVSTLAFDAPNVQNTHLFLGGVNLRWDLFDGAITQVVRANRNETDNATVDLFGPSSNRGGLEKLNYLATYRLGFLTTKHSFSGLIESEDEHFTPSSDFVERSRERESYVAAYRGEYFDRLFTDVSVRKDDNKPFVDFNTWHADASVSLREIGLRPHGSVGTGVALPGMFEQFGFVAATFFGNPNLKPEESFSWDAGAEFEVVKDNTFVDVTYFHANLTNEIAFNNLGNSVINLPGESKREGIEVGARTNLMPNLLVGASYTYLNAREPSGAEEIRRPPHSGRADITYLFDAARGTVNVAAIYNGDMKDTNFGSFPAQTVILDAYLLVNAAVSYKLQPNLEIYTRVENALNEDYEEISGFNTPGFAAYAGIRMTLEDPETASWAKYK